MSTDPKNVRGCRHPGTVTETKQNLYGHNLLVSGRRRMSEIDVFFFFLTTKSTYSWCPLFDSSTSSLLCILDRNVRTRVTQGLFTQRVTRESYKTGVTGVPYFSILRVLILFNLLRYFPSLPVFVPYSWKRYSFKFTPGTLISFLYVLVTRTEGPEKDLPWNVVESVNMYDVDGIVPIKVSHTTLCLYHYLYHVSWGREDWGGEGYISQLPFSRFTRLWVKEVDILPGLWVVFPNNTPNLLYLIYFMGSDTSRLRSMNHLSSIINILPSRPEPEKPPV